MKVYHYVLSKVGDKGVMSVWSERPLQLNEGTVEQGDVVSAQVALNHVGAWRVMAVEIVHADGAESERWLRLGAAVDGVLRAVVEAKGETNN